MSALLSELSNARLITIVLGSVMALSWALTWTVRRYAIRADILDRPNERSSHAVPTPRGGGVAIVLAHVIGTAAMAFFDIVTVQLAVASLGGGLVVATLGFVDDRRPLSARIRFAGHLLGALWIVGWLGSLPALPIAGAEITPGRFGQFMAIVFITWSINLFNFMDGIDGIAGTQAITVCISGAILWGLTSGASDAWLAVLLAASVAGFLLWNFPHAKIFMGDAGSGFLGLMIAFLTLWAGTERPVLFWSWLILYGCFMVDATTTLIRRVRRGEKFHVAHRSHAYQYAARRLGSHVPVTLVVAAINVFWLLPLAATVAYGHLDGAVGLGVAYFPLLLLVFRLKAGDRAAQESA